MQKNTVITNGLSEKDNDLALSIKAFLSDRKAQNLAIGTLDFYQRKISLFLIFCSTRKIEKMTDISPEVIRDFLIHLKNTGHNEGGIHGFYRVIRTFLYFWENEFEPENYKNPIRKVKAPKVSIEPIEGVSTENVSKLLDFCEKKTFFGERDRTIILTLLETGIRAQELCSLNFEDIDFSESSLLIRQGKGRKPRYVFIGRTVRKQLRTWIKYRGGEKGSLFTTKAGERINYWSLREIIRRLSQKAGIPEVGLHDFRRTFALESWRRGVDIQTLSRLMGHADLQVLSRYLKQNPRDLGGAFVSIVDNE